MLCFFKKLDDGQIPPPLKKVSVNFIHALFFLLDFLTFEDGVDRLSWNTDDELPLYAM